MFRIDPHSGEPIYRQLVDQIKFRIAGGRLAPDERLPSIRELAQQLNVNARTVVKAYEELEHAALVVRRHGQGVFVAPRSAGAPAAARRKALREMSRHLLAEACRLGANVDEVHEAIDVVAEQMQLDRPEPRR